MGDSLDQEVHGGEFGPAEFALPVHLDGAFGLRGREVAVDLVEE